MKRLDGKSLDNIRMRIDELKELFPEAVSEGYFDRDVLMSLLDGEFYSEHEERYRFEWKGKQESLKLAQKRSSGTLRPMLDESKNWETTKNLYIEGDNLEVLKLLQQAYLHQVKMIYIDPPYNTGNDFVYKDDFKDPIKGYKESTAQAMRANPETAGRYHSNWLSMMYPRLRIAKTLLQDDGVIFISIDDNEVHNLRKLCDEVFGEENFVANLIWEKKFAPQNDAKWFSENHDHIICYARNKTILNIKLLPRSEEVNLRYKNTDNDSRGVWTSGDLLRKDEQKSGLFTITTPNGTEYRPPSGRSWRVSEDKFKEMVADNRIWFGEDGGNVPRIKRFLSEVQDGMKSQTIFKYNDVGHNQEASQELRKLFDGESYFDTPKPLRLIKRLGFLITDNNDLILDFFSGSATTAHAVMQLNAEDGGNRRYIMVQLDEKTDENSEAYMAGYKTIADIGRERIRRAGGKIVEKNPLLTKTLDTGFRSFKLDTSNLKKWDDNFEGMDKEQQVTTLLDRLENSLDELKSDRREIDVIYEIFLKYGVALTEPLAQLEVNGKKFYAVGDDGYIFICLDKGITVETIEHLIKDYTPGTIIFADQSFKTDDDITNTLLVLQKAEIEFRWI